MPQLTFKPYKHLNIRNIIFDLGGVILDIDYQKTLNEFKKLGINNLENLFTQTSQTELFNKLDCGLISEDDFRATLKQHINIPLSNADIDFAWNALLLEWNIERLTLLENLMPNYKIFLLSNTNIIHSKIYNQKLMNLTNGKDLKHFFHKVYYSYEIGLRKPNPEIFKLVLTENNLLPNETLFIDDTLEHINAARALAINCYNINPKAGETVLDLFS